MFQDDHFGFKLDFPPVQDSPSTPASPSSPVDISGSGNGLSQQPGRKSELGTPVSNPSVVNWVNCQGTSSAGVYHPDFHPQTLESAIEYFRTTSQAQFPPKFPRSGSLETPHPSRSAKMQCHGCHGSIGQGAHIGSGTGKNLCTLDHSDTCPGGIAESDSWRACIAGYIFQPREFNFQV